MTTTLNPLALYRERIPQAHADFDARFGPLPVPQRRKDMARRLWTQVHAQVPEMPEPKVRHKDGRITLAWVQQPIAVEAVVSGSAHGYELWAWEFKRYTDGVTFQPNTHSLEPLIRVCQRFVQATAREAR